MNTLSLETMREAIYEISNSCVNEGLPRYSASDIRELSQAVLNLSAAWQALKESDIHEQFHTVQEPFTLPGEFGGSSN